MKNVTWKAVLRPALLLALAVGSRSAYGQGASSTASLSASISVFAGGSSIDPDYGPNRQGGYLFGGDYTHYFRRLYVDPSLEVRASVTPLGNQVGEKVYGGGLKVEHAYYGRLHPYADFLIGAGTIKYQGNSSDNSTVYTYGGGLDVDVIKHFAVKAEFQESHWHPGKQITYTPNALSVAVVYHIPFATRYGR